MKEEKEWFETWFDSEYYHLLYKNRDQEEAVFFIDNLLEALKLKPESSLLDLCCGKGRHAVYLASKGYNVTGIDNSVNSIMEAAKNEKENLHFYVHDMRVAFPGKKFDTIFNLFTSFGYFCNEDENQSVINAISDSLNDDGILVLDYLNVVKAANVLIPAETKIVDGIKFHLTREIKDGFIQKHISFRDKDKLFGFNEKVRNYTLTDFHKMLNATSLQINATFGDYSLSPFNEISSPRLIIVAQKRK